MKVLYISHNKEGTAWSSTANNNMLAMNSVGIDVVSRTIKLNESNPSIPDIIQEFENKNTNNIDYIIQHLLPHHYEATTVCKNIGMYLNDMDTLNMATWCRKISLMDRIWCPNLKTKSAIESYNKNVDIIPHTCDTSIYDKTYQIMDFGHNNSNFIFYFIGELNSRKNIKDLIRAFHTEFSTSEPVSLLLKVNKSGVNPIDVKNGINDEINNVKNSLKLYPNIEDYHKEIIISDFISEEDIYRLHNTCHCYVNTSHGEAWSIPTFDAQAFGNKVIAPKNQYDYLVNPICYESYSDDIIGYSDTFHQLGNAKEKWVIPNISDLRRCMRLAYTNGKPILKYTDNITNDIIQKHSIKNIGNLMLRKLNEYSNY